MKCSRLAFLILFGAIVFASAASAQSVSKQLSFASTDAPATIANYTATYQIDSAVATSYVPVCAAQGTGSVCQFTLPKADSDKLDVSGTHALVVVLTSPISGRQGTGSGSFTPGASVASPTDVKIVIIIKVP